MTLAALVPPSNFKPGTGAGSVGYAVNLMLDNVAYASRELRIPLTATRGDTELMRMT